MSAKGNLSQREWRALKLAVLERDGYACKYCRKPLSYESATMDHVMPRSKGGPTVAINLVPACRKCNTSKADGMPAPAALASRGALVRGNRLMCVVSEGGRLVWREVVSKK